MRAWFMSALVFGLVALTAGSSLAQDKKGKKQGGFGGGFGGGGLAMLLANESVQKELKLTDDQAAQGNREEAMKKLRALRKETLDKALAVLSDDEKKAWKDLTGEAFEVPRRGNN